MKILVKASQYSVNNFYKLAGTDYSKKFYKLEKKIVEEKILI